MSMPSRQENSGIFLKDGGTLSSSSNVFFAFMHRNKIFSHIICIPLRKSFFKENTEKFKKQTSIHFIEKMDP